MRTSDGPVSSTTRRKSSKSSIPACRVRVIPVSGAQHASAQEILHAAVHSIYSRDGRTPASIGRTGGASAFFRGSFRGQSPQNFEPPPFKSPRSEVATGPVHTSCSELPRASPRTLRPYGSAHPHTRRPSHSMTNVVQGHEHVKRVARWFRDTSEERDYFFASFFRYASSLSFSYFTVLRNRLSARYVRRSPSSICSMRC
jgi:hypothetical protein